MQEDSSEVGFRHVLETFEALAQNLDDRLALNAADGADPEVGARLERARALAVQGSSKVREHLDQPRDEQLQKYG